jgi:hypothetical protein
VNNRQDLQRKLEQTKRFSALAGDLTARQRLFELRDELIEALEKSPQRPEHITDSCVRERAHDVWEQHGCPNGRDEEFWLTAERELVEGSRSH